MLECHPSKVREGGKKEGKKEGRGGGKGKGNKEGMRGRKRKGRRKEGSREEGRKDLQTQSQYFSHFTVGVNHPGILLQHAGSGSVDLRPGCAGTCAPF